MKKINILLFLIPIFSFSENTKAVATFLQDISVTIKSERGHSKSEGSGVLILKKIDGEDVTFVLTAAHVVDNLRSIR